jgi:hypothetical protein
MAGLKRTWNGIENMAFTTDGQDVFRCKKCRRIIGIMIDGGRRIQVGGLMLYRLHGECECGETVHWDNSDVLFRRLMSHLEVEVKE